MLRTANMKYKKKKSDNEIYLLIKYIKSFLWRVAKCLSYIEDARCLKFNIAGNSKTYLGLHVKCTIFLSEFNQNLDFVDKFFIEATSINFYGYPFSGSVSVTCRKTYRRTDELICRR